LFDDRDGKIIRMKPSIYNKTVADAIKQLPVSDVTRNHMGDAGMFLNTINNLSGANLIAFRALEKYMEILLERDKEYAPFQILGLELDEEERGMVTIDLSDGRGVNIKGSIDRLDEKEGMIRILDYKTGKSELEFSSLESLFNADDDKRNAYAFQTLLYGFMARRWGVATEEDNLHAGILNFRSNKDPKWELTMSKNPLGNINRVLDAVSEKLKDLFDEIYDPKKHWSQVEDAGKCKNCPYNVICDR
jgi:CRISPR/Cas system-associated exonuclease Cas4 (RecB family)